MKRALIVMSKIPEPGSVKTRLRPFLSDSECVSLATAFLLDTESKARAADCETIFSVSPAVKMESITRLFEEKPRLIGQSGSTLGERMHNAFFEILSGDAEAAVMVGTDCPLMSASHIENAHKLLEEGSEAVIGPSEDGGFYLIGLRAADFEVFEGVEWGTPRAFSQTHRNLERIGCKPLVLPVCYDIDVEADLRRLFLERELLSEAARHTYKWLNSNAHLFKARS